MQKTWKWILLSSCAAFSLQAETGADVKLDNPQARVLAVVLEPHQPASVPERAMNRVLVFRDAGQLAIKSQTGKVEKIDLKEGDARWDPSGTPYTIENTTDRPIRFFEIELKNKAQGPAPVSKLDPTVVDSHYKIEFENEQVRVLRIHYGPNEKGSLHEHILNRVVCYLNDQGRTKAGDVRMAGAATHTEENAADQPADRIAVELK